jgi:two-component system KDP operon response regulator KdpE
MSERGRDPEALIIYALCVLVSAPFVIAAIVHREPLGAGTALCMLLTAFGIGGLVLELRRRAHLPRARVVHRADRPTSNRSVSVPAVLLVEDEPAIRQFVRMTLESHGLHVIEATTLVEAQQMIVSARPAAVLLDLGLPDGDGLQLLRARASTEKAPVIVMSARHREHDKIAALDAGADDYLHKPFDPRDLLARVQLAIQRARPLRPIDEPLRVGPFRIDPARAAVTIDGNAMQLTATELRLLTALARQPGKLFTHRQLIDAVWGPGTVHGVHDLRVHVSALRRKIEADPVRPRWLMTETGVGYRLRAYTDRTDV